MSAEQLIRFDVLCSTTLLLELVAQAHRAMQSTDTLKHTAATATI